MKNGVRQRLFDNPPLPASALDSFRPPKTLGRIMGIRVRYDHKQRQIAKARGIWPFKNIAVGPLWFGLHVREQRAILLHEVGHCRMFHMEQRLLLLPFFMTDRVRKLTHDQEMQADAFAVQHNHGVELMGVINRFQAGSPFHPDAGERCNAIKKLIKERIHVVTAA